MSILNQLDSYISKADQHNESVSKASVGWQIEHILLTYDVIIADLKREKDRPYNPRMGFWKLVVLSTGWFPRGKVRAPKLIRPADYDQASLTIHLKHVKNVASTLDALPANVFFKHPIFGDLNRDTAIKFLQIHTHHHLKIIRDILKD